MPAEIIKINENDNVAVAVTELSPGMTVSSDGARMTVHDRIPAGHKISLRMISEGENIIKYGFPIGRATTGIPAGSHVHSHNVKSNLDGQLSYEYTPDFSDPEPREPEHFLGYVRSGGRVGVRNEVWIIPTVGCVNGIAAEIERRSQKYLTEKIDGIVSFSHPYGCSQLGSDMQLTLKFLAGLVRHPNAAAVLVLGLGCENGNIGELKKVLGTWDDRRVRFINCQDHSDEVAAALNEMEYLCGYAGTFSREVCPASRLTVGLKCGGSDGFSGITANPLLGAFSDRLAAQGGSVILTEVPEMFGAEQILMNRCRTRKQFDDTVNLINGFKSYFTRYGERIDENPSPGNREGGITTLEDKSLGCTQKGGTVPVEDVLLYGDQVRKNGLSLLQAPGNDLVAACALAASGAQIVLFTTGRGTPFGCPVPTLKISSNTALSEKKPAWIDFDAGCLLNGAEMNELCDGFTELVLDVASGRKHTKSESLDRHNLAILKDGVTL